MKKFAMVVGLFALALPSLLTTPASAQATRTWISGVGDDANPCSRTAPCKTFPGAIAKTAPGGEIDTLDPGGFGAVTVTKAITMADEGVGEGGILVAGTNGITVNCSTDPNCVVIVRGLVIDGGPIGSNSLSGIRFVAGKTLEVEHTTIRNFNGGSPNGYGIWFNPSASQLTELDVNDCTITSNGQAGGGVGIGGGIEIQQSLGTPNIRFSIKNTQVYNNTNGIRIDAQGATGGSVNGVITNTVIDQTANHGLALNTGVGGTTKMNVVFDRSQSVNSTGDGAVANGPQVTLQLTNSVITGSSNLGVQVANSGVIDSYKNNIISGNNNDNLAVLTLVNPT
ncbi:MAG TPA: hypothetical protein VMH86_00780 [Rhizomicrobium sp.]|nr:hypothetical protein [Rhizomicrobium sp.]